MKKTFIGIVTFGNINFTRLAIQSIKETVQSFYDIVLVIGKPDDIVTLNFAKENKINYIVHKENKGFPASINDLYDWGFKNRNYDYFVAMGNDVIAYPYAIDSLIRVADDTDYEWMCSREFHVRALCKAFPDARKHFEGNDFIFRKFGKVRPWEHFTAYSNNIQISKAGLSDVHNLALYKRSVFDKIGYVDVNFYPAYYEDNDYVRRSVHKKISSCTVKNSFYFHFWSRTIKQESGGSTSKNFQNNKNFYITKWGGDFGKEKWNIPFNNKPYQLGNVILEPNLSIHTRDQEKDIIKYWRNKN